MKAKVSIRVEFKQTKSLEWRFYVTTIKRNGEKKVERFKSSITAQKYVMEVLECSTCYNTHIHKSLVIEIEKDFY